MQHYIPNPGESYKWHKLHNIFNSPKNQEPFDIVISFFNNYTIAEIRERLSDWFFDTLQEDNSAIKQHAVLYNDIDKVIEAILEVVHDVCGDNAVLPSK